MSIDLLMVFFIILISFFVGFMIGLVMGAEGGK